MSEIRSENALLFISRNRTELARQRHLYSNDLEDYICPSLSLLMRATDAQFFPSVSLSNGMRSVGLSSQLKLFLRTHVHASFHAWLHFLGFLCSVVAISTELLYAAYLTMTLHS